MVIAHHLILTGYGHWLPGDPRGSMSREVRTEGMIGRGEPHYGRRRNQPTRPELRRFRREAEARLQHPVLWFEEEPRRHIGEAFGQVIVAERLTCYACAVLRNHAHLVVRKHRLRGEEIIDLLKPTSRQALSAKGLLPAFHPLWSSDRCDIFKDTPEAVRAAIDYVRLNLPKHNLPEQHWDFVQPYDNWPFHNRRPRAGRER